MALIYILGNSPIFLRAAKLAYPEDKITVFSWRNCFQCLVENDVSDNPCPDIILLCGYDYGAAGYPFKLFFDVNVQNPCRWVSAVASMDTKVIYINTLPPTKRVTYSRYLLAKNSLAICLQQNNQNFFNISIATIVDKKMNPKLYGGILSRLLFIFFIRLGLVRTTREEHLVKLITLGQLSKTISIIPRIHGKFIEIPRNILLDRVLRMLCG